MELGVNSKEEVLCRLGLDNLKETRYGWHLCEMRRSSRFHFWNL
jgi:hypothetical protein